MFADHLHEPIFGMLRVPVGATGDCSLTLPSEVSVLPLNRSTRRPLHRRALADFNWERALFAGYLEKVDAVCCIYPDWSAVHIHRMATARQMLSFACLLGDWAEVYERMASAAPPIKRQLLRRLARQADLAVQEAAGTSRVLFCVGQALADRYGHLAPHTVVCSANTQEEGDIRERKDTCDGPPFKLLCVAEFHPRKGIEVLLEAVAQISREGHPVELHLVGDGDLRAGLEERAKTLGIAPLTRFRGFVHFGPELLSVYRECDLFILPSLAGEGCPRVLVEAMSQGTPVIGTDVGSVRHVLGEGARGLVVPPGDAGALARAVATLLADGDLRRRLICEGLEHARTETYSVQRGRIGEALRQYAPEVVKVSPEGES
jgi:glycosyltransferase involved in cell wall biosynthesis